MAEFELFPVESNKMALDNLDQLWRPSLALSRGLGVFPFVARNGDRKVPWWRNWWNFLSVIYIADVCVCASLITVVVVKYGLSGNWVRDSAKYITNMAFYLHVALSTAVFVNFLNCKTYLRDLCHLWSSLPFRFTTAALLCADVKRKVRRILALSVAGGLVYVLEFFGIIFCGMHLNVPTVFVLASKCWFDVSNAVNVGLFCTVCCTTSCILHHFCQDLEARLTEGNMDLHLQWFREAYTRVTDFVDVANRLFGKFLGFLVTSYLIQTCCTTYIFFPYGSIHNMLVLTIDIMNLLEGFVIVGIVCWMAGEVFEKGKRPYRILLKTGLMDSPSNKQIQVLMLSLDASKNVVPTMYMFETIPLTKSTVSVIISIYMSYVFLLYQFPQGSTAEVNPAEATNITALYTNNTM